MSLSRWSHSNHYIYVVDKDRLQVLLFGHFTSYTILNRYRVIDRSARREDMSLYDRLELYAYLIIWAKAERKQIDWDIANKLIKVLRNIGRLRHYVKGYTEDMPEFEVLFPIKYTDEEIELYFPCKYIKLKTKIKKEE